MNNVVSKLRAAITVELEGMEPLVLNTVLNDIIGAAATSNEIVTQFDGMQ